MEKTLKELAQYVGGKVLGDGSIKIRGVMTIDEAQKGHITFLANEKYSRKLKQTRASAVIVSPKFKNIDKPLIVTDNPYLAFARVVDLMMRPEVKYHRFVHPTAIVNPGAKIGKDVSVYPNVFLGEKVKLADRVVLYPGVYVGDGSEIGEDTVLYPNVVIYPGTIIGKRVVIHANTVIGSSGFGYAPDGRHYFRIPQVGTTIIEDDVEIGANTTINRGALGATRIKRGTKIDSQVVISHNVEIGEDSLIVSQVGIAGTARLGDHVTLAGQVGVVGHIKIGDNVTVGAQSGVANDLPGGGTYLGSPAIPIEKMRRSYAAIGKLPELMEMVRSLNKRLKRLEERWKK